eukprot:g6184.t3
MAPKQGRDNPVDNKVPRVHTRTGEVTYRFVNGKPVNPMPHAVVPTYGALVHPAPSAYGMLPPPAPYPPAFQGYGGVAVAPYWQHQTGYSRPPTEQPMMLVWSWPHSADGLRATGGILAVFVPADPERRWRDLCGIRDFQELAFSEWLDAITTYCLFEEEDILRFCFFILDREKNGYIEKDEMRMLVNMLYNIDPVKGPTGNTKVAFEKLSVQQDGKIEFWEFELFNKAFPSLFFPAFRLQVKMMQAVWGEKWWGRKKRKLQDNLEERRRNEEMDRLADTNRLENMRQRRIKRKMGACKYYCWPCGRAEYDKMFPRANIVVADPEADEAERQRKIAEDKARLQREMEARYLNPETQEYKKFREKMDAKKQKEKNQRDKKPKADSRRPVKLETKADERRLRLENRRVRNGRVPTAGGAFD